MICQGVSQLNDARLPEMRELEKRSTERYQMAATSRRWFISVVALASLTAVARSAWTGVLGLTFDSNRPIESKALHCPSGFLTGIRVKYGRTRQEDRDLYDFKLKCGNRWTAWSGLWFKNEVEDKTMECPSKMYVTGVEVKRGRNDFTDRDTYDFKLQCSGVWQSYIGMRSSKEQEIAAGECPSGEGTSGIKVYRGFVEWGDKDLYEFELNCKSIAQNLASIRGLPDLKMLGLPRNVLTWDAEQLGTWLDALGLGDLVAAFQAHNVDGGTVFLLTEEHLKELGFSLVGDRLYFVEVRARTRTHAHARHARARLAHARAHVARVHSRSGGVCSRWVLLTAVWSSHLLPAV